MLYDRETLEKLGAAEAMAKHVLFSATALRRWPWYRAEQQRIMAEVGRDVALHDAMSEIYRLRELGYTDTQAINLCERWLRDEWRPRYSSQYSTYQAVALPLEDERAQSVTTSREDEEVHAQREAFIVAKIGEIRAALTDQEWEYVVAKGTYGSLRKAAAVCGVSKSAIERAVRKARAAGVGW